MIRSNDTYVLAKVISDQEFPAYESIIPTTKPVIEITLDADHLKEICTAFAGEYIKINLYGKFSAVVFEGGNEPKRALLMPIQT